MVGRWFGRPLVLATRRGGGASHLSPPVLTYRNIQYRLENITRIPLRLVGEVWLNLLSIKSLIDHCRRAHIIPKGRTMSSTTAALRSLSIDNINPHVKAARYAVRGELAVRAEEYRRQLQEEQEVSSEKKQHQQKTRLPFDRVVSANIGNPQQLGQKPLTFFRQVASLLEYPTLLEKEDVLLNQLDYKQDALDRARWLLKECGSVGAYSQSQGVPGIRESIARFIESVFPPPPPSSSSLSLRLPD